MDSSVGSHVAKAEPKTKKEKRAEKKLKKELKRVAKEKKQTMDCLERETAFGKESDIRSKWTSYCESLKSSEMIEETKAISQMMIGNLDRSNHTIKTLQEDRLRAEQHHSISLQNMSALIDCFMGKNFQTSYRTPSTFLCRFRYLQNVRRQRSLFI